MIFVGAAHGEARGQGGMVRAALSVHAGRDIRLRQGAGSQPGLAWAEPHGREKVKAEKWLTCSSTDSFASAVRTAMSLRSAMDGPWPFVAVPFAVRSGSKAVLGWSIESWWPLTLLIATASFMLAGNSPRKDRERGVGLCLVSSRRTKISTVNQT